MTDAHNHLQDKRFDGVREEVIKTMRQAGITRCIVNGTRPSDWEQVAHLALSHPDFIIPSFGLHPWYVSDIDEVPDWIEQLNTYLDTTPHACIGECGLDRRIKGFDFTRQINVFKQQLAFASERNRPISIHCVRTWGGLIDILESHPLPTCGMLIHSYGGSAELIPRLTKLGAYFSFSGTILHPKKQKTRAIFQSVPPDRLLIESDAPDMLPPENAITHPLPNGLNHPANLPNIKKLASPFLDTSLITDNFKALITS